MEAVHERPKRWSEATPVKLFVLALLVLVLLIPLGRIGWLVDERASRLAEVGAEVAGTWGGAQTISGPVLALPYRYEVLIEQEEVVGDDGKVRRPRPKRQVFSGTAYLLPKELRLEGAVEPEVRYRGIFEVVVYVARLKAQGFFDPGELADLGIEPGAFQWEKAGVALGLSDPKGLAQGVTLEVGGREASFAPGTAGADFFPTGIHAPEILAGEAGRRLLDLSAAAAGGRPAGSGPGGIPGTLAASGASAQGPPPAGGSPGDRLPFSFDLVLRGTGDLHFFPAGEETWVDLSSPWPSPSFGGAYLPGEREVGDEGFSARWRVPYLGRNLPQAWLDAGVDAGRLYGSAFGVGLILPADGYQKTERSIKYGVLFILLTFVTFFLLELVSPARLHAMHYLLVGSALCLFYLLLLSLSEHLGFGPAYLLGAGGSTVLIGAYSRTVLASGRFALLLGGSLAALYGYLYVLLQAEDYALLLGSVGLFLILALVMYLTRRLDWRSLKYTS
jgi:inner membrane protein